MGSIMWESSWWRPPLCAVWLGGPALLQSPFSPAQEGPPWHTGPCLFTQLGPQAVCGTRPNGSYSYSLLPRSDERSHTLALDVTLFILVTGYGSEVILQQYSVTTTLLLPLFKLNSSPDSCHSVHKHQHFLSKVRDVKCYDDTRTLFY